MIQCLEIARYLSRESRTKLKGREVSQKNCAVAPVWAFRSFPAILHFTHTYISGYKRKRKDIFLYTSVVVFIGIHTDKWPISILYSLSFDLSYLHFHLFNPIPISTSQITPIMPSKKLTHKNQ